MSGGLYPVAGSKLFIGGPMPRKGDVTAADFQGQVWTEIDGWANAGALGDTQNTAEQDLINQKRTQGVKTTLNGGSMDNQFVPMALDPGQIKFKEAISDCRNFAFKVEWGADCAPSSEVTISVADPGVVSWTGHGLEIGQPVVFSTSGTLPAGLTAGVVYYVIAAGLTANSFSVSAAAGGAGVETTTAGSGAHTAVAPPAGMTDLFIGLALPGARQGGGATAVHLRNWSIRVNSNIVEV